MIHKNLEVWKRSISLVVKVYAVTKLFPAEERFGLTQQMRRAAVSIPSNIAEGSARKSTNELRQFLYVSLGSLAELETQMIICERLQYFLADPSSINQDLDEIRRMLQSIIKSLVT